MALNLLDPFDNQAQTQAAQAQIAGIQAGQTAANQNIGQAQNAITTGYGNALTAYLPELQSTTNGADMLGNSLGINGSQGSAQAMQAFQNANPGYQFQLNQGLNAVNARAAANGMSNSGNTQLALQNFGQGLANTTYNQWQSQLQPYLQAQNSATGGVANVDTGQANALAGQNDIAANINYGADTSIGNANANAALGNLTGAANLWGLGTGLLALGAGSGATVGSNAIAGAGNALSGLGSGIKSLFS